MTGAGLIRRRLFLFGCERSGTTLLQIMLSRHSDIFSTPETEFFRNTVGSRRGWLAKLGLATGKERNGLRKTCEAMRLADYPLRYRPSIFYGTTARTFLSYLDAQAQAEGRSIWLEKSPRHLFHVDVIRRYVDGVHFIHIFRRGEDVIGSILDRAQKYLGSDSRQHDVFDGVNRWNRAIAESAKFVGQPGPSFVHYESLVRRPDAVLDRLCRDIGIEFERAMTESGVYDSVISSSRPHLANSAAPITPPESKFERLVPLHQQERVRQALDMPLYEHLVDQFRFSR